MTPRIYELFLLLRSRLNLPYELGASFCSSSSVNSLVSACHRAAVYYLAVLNDSTDLALPEPLDIDGGYFSLSMTF